MTNFFSGKKKLFAFLILIAIALAIPLTVFVSQQQQTIKQRAEAKDVKLYFTEQNSTTPITSFQVTEGGPQPYALSLWLDPQGQSIEGFDFTISTNNLSINGPTESNDRYNLNAGKFDILLFTNHATDFRAYRLTKFYSGKEILNQKIHLLDFSIHTLVITAETSLAVTDAKIISSDPTKKYLSVEKPEHTFSSIFKASLTPTPTPTSATQKSAPTPKQQVKTGSGFSCSTNIYSDDACSKYIKTETSSVCVGEYYNSGCKFIQGKGSISTVCISSLSCKQGFYGCGADNTSKGRTKYCPNNNMCIAPNNDCYNYVKDCGVYPYYVCPENTTAVCTNKTPWCRPSTKQVVSCASTGTDQKNPSVCSDSSGKCQKDYSPYGSTNEERFGTDCSTTISKDAVCCFYQPLSSSPLQPGAEKFVNFFINKIIPLFPGSAEGKNMFYLWSSVMPKLAALQKKVNDGYIPTDKELNDLEAEAKSEVVLPNMTLIQNTKTFTLGMIIRWVDKTSNLYKQAVQLGWVETDLPSADIVPGTLKSIKNLAASDLISTTPTPTPTSTFPTSAVAVPAATKTPTPVLVKTVTIQGHYVDQNGKPTGSNGRTITISGGAISSPVTAANDLNPKYLWKKDSLPPSDNSYTVTASSLTAGYTISYVACTNTNCNQESARDYIAGNSVSVNLLTAEDYADIWFKYTPIAPTLSPTLSPTPTSSPILTPTFTPTATKTPTPTISKCALSDVNILINKRKGGDASVSLSEINAAINAYKGGKPCPEKGK